MLSGGMATLVAALIAAIASLVGLVLAKEQKTSEFRQAWIDQLRFEFADYLSAFTEMRDQVQRNFPSNSHKLEVLSPLYSKLNRASNMVRLRLNPVESETEEITSVMDCMENLSQDDLRLVGPTGDTLEDDLRGKAQALLKREWDRVRKGERAYRVAKIAAALLVGLCLLLLFLGFILDIGADGAESIKSARTVIVTEMRESEVAPDLPHCAEPLSCPHQRTPK